MVMCDPVLTQLRQKAQLSTRGTKSILFSAIPSPKHKTHCQQTAYLSLTLATHIPRLLQSTGASRFNVESVGSILEASTLQIT